MIVLDASVLIAHLDARDALNDRATELLRLLAAHSFAASQITLAEVLVGPVRAGRIELASAALRALEVETLPLPEDAAPLLAILRAETGLRLPDCCVLLAAQGPGDAIATFDERLASAARARGLGLDHVLPG